jgi:hypothetical protein
MSETLFNVVMIFLFILIGGVFAAAEMALVSLRDSQVKQLARRGKRGRLIAQLTGDPNRFLSAVQIGVTLAGFLSAAFGRHDDRQGVGTRPGRPVADQPGAGRHDCGDQCTAVIPMSRSCSAN